MPLHRLAEIWREIAAPSERNERPYLSMLIAIGHAVLGAALHPYAAGAAGAARLAMFYFVGKETRDLRKGASLRDSLTDTAFIVAGTFYGAPWWPAVILAAALIAAII